MDITKINLRLNRKPIKRSREVVSDPSILDETSFSIRLVDDSVKKA